ncbi:MAG: hypothetical protein H0W34_00435 [Pyrinomonadaceae bacterium]|jgi:hypothetical protein|nr:hypothetical protein [Pyrinomonadaceae bacterium]
MLYRTFLILAGRYVTRESMTGCSADYLVSNAFEHSRGTPILGMETFFEKRPSLTRQRPGRASIWDWIAAPTTSTDITRRSNSTSHGGFDDDEATRIAVIERIVRRQSASSAPNATASRARSSRKSQ